MLYVVPHRLSFNCKESHVARSRSAGHTAPRLRILPRAAGWMLSLAWLAAGALCSTPALAQAAAAATAAPTVATPSASTAQNPPPAAPAAAAAPGAPAPPGSTAAPGAPAARGSAAAPAAPGAAAPSGDAAPSTDAAAPDTRGLDEQVQGLKKDVVDLNRDLFVLEEELLYPANTQVAVFLSMDVGDFFALDSVQLKIDQKEVINYLYTPREVEALMKGGVHRLYVGNLKVGKHELVAFFSGKGPNDRAYKRGATLTFEKGIGAKYLELKINDRQRRLQPEFEIKDWE
jgi:hypothetical protein